MKLFDPSEAEKFVFAVCPRGYKEGTAPQYVGIAGGDMETAEKQLSLGSKPLVSVYPHACGRYDDFGRYCTYQAPVEGVRPGKFILHPLAQEEYLASRSF